MGQHLHRSGVLAAVGYNDVCVALAGFHKGFVHRLDGKSGTARSRCPDCGRAPLRRVPDGAGCARRHRCPHRSCSRIGRTAPAPQRAGCLPRSAPVRAQCAAPCRCGCGWSSRTPGSRWRGLPSAPADGRSARRCQKHPDGRSSACSAPQRAARRGACNSCRGRSGALHPRQNAPSAAEQGWSCRCRSRLQCQ